jgi:hypothetical protein
VPLCGGARQLVELFVELVDEGGFESVAVHGRGLGRGVPSSRLPSTFSWAI